MGFASALPVEKALNSVAQPILRKSDASEAQLDLHRPVAVASDLKGHDGVVEAVGAGQQRLQVDHAAIDQIDREAELLVKPEGAAEFDFLGNGHVERQGHLAVA